MDSIHSRLADGGPRYVETPPGDYPFERALVEPYNAVTASFFVVIVLVWIVRLRGRYRGFPFLVGCLPILLVGGIGGTVYHATRSDRVWFLMDLIPIRILGFGAGIFLWWRLKPRWYHLLLVTAMTALLNSFRGLPVPRHWAINLSYASIALFIVLPVGFVLARTNYRAAGWVATTLILFAIAWCCRILDTVDPPILPMGTHWLWHTFGALATYCLAEYFYRLELGGGEAKKAT